MKEHVKQNAPLHIFYWIAAILGIVLLQYVMSGVEPTARIPYSEFEQYLNSGKVDEISISDRFIRGTLDAPLPSGQTRFVTTRVDPEFAAELQRNGVRFSGAVESTTLRDFLSWIVPTALFVGVWLFLIRRMMGGAAGGGLMQIGKSRAKVYVESDTRVTFEDVAGVDEAKDESVGWRRRRRVGRRRRDRAHQQRAVCAGRGDGAGRSWRGTVAGHCGGTVRPHATATRR